MTAGGRDRAGRLRGRARSSGVALVLALGILSRILPALAATGAAGPQTWLAPLPPLAGQSGGAADFMALFQPGAAWRAAAGHVQVLKLPTQFIDQASDAELATIFAALRRRHMALALEALMQSGDGACGHEVEGYTGRETAPRIAGRIKRLGGELGLLAMDEPLYYGHEYRGPHACRSSVAGVARDVAQNIRAYKAVFPAAKVGDIEPVMGFLPAAMPAEIGDWAQAFAAATGEPLAFLHLDLDWRARWQEAVPRLAALLRARKIPLGVIYDGAPEDATDAAWVADAMTHYEAYEAAMPPPDEIVFQSWNAHPTRVLPETSPATLTYLVASYFRPQPVLEVRRAGGKIAGRLLDPAGRPIAAAPLSLEGFAPGGPGFPVEEIIQSVVPAAAASAVVGPEINLGCACAGASEVTIGAFRYRETAGGKAAAERDFAHGLAGWESEGTAAAAIVREPPPAAPRLRIVTRPSETLYLHAAPFRVTPGAAFRFGATVEMSPSAEDIGYLVAIFLDAQGEEIERARILLRPGYARIGETRTGADGRFEMPLPADAAANAMFQVIFQGDARYRSRVQAIR